MEEATYASRKGEMYHTREKTRERKGDEKVLASLFHYRATRERYSYGDARQINTPDGARQET